MKKPKKLTGDHLVFLDELRASGDMNMYGARAYLMEEFSELSKKEAGEILSYWMETFSERNL
jgi:hypothetical protein